MSFSNMVHHKNNIIFPLLEGKSCIIKTCLTNYLIKYNFQLYKTWLSLYSLFLDGRKGKKGRKEKRRKLLYVLGKKLKKGTEKEKEGTDFHGAHLFFFCFLPNWKEMSKKGELYKRPISYPYFLPWKSNNLKENYSPLPSISFLFPLSLFC